jgi:hypothetical protein
MGKSSKTLGKGLFAVLVGGVSGENKAFSPPVFHPANVTLVRSLRDGQIMSV